MKPWWHWTELFSEPIRFFGNILCAFGLHKRVLTYERVGVYKVWFVECARLDCSWQHRDHAFWDGSGK